MIKSLELMLVYYIVAILLGSLMLRVDKDYENGIVKSIFYGNAMMFFVFQILVIPMTMLGQSLSNLTKIFEVIMLVICILAILLSKQIIIYIKNALKNIKSYSYLNALIILLVCIQVFICVKYVFLHANDAYYVGMTTTTLQTDRLYEYSPYTGETILWSNYKYHVIASMPVYLAMIAKIFGISGAFMCHSVAPMLFIPIGYILYREIGYLLFKKDKRKVNIFLILICVINMFIGKNYDSSYEMLSTSIWQGGSYLYNIVLPAIFYFEYRFLMCKKTVTDLTMLLIMVVIGVMTVPVTGGILSLMVVIILGFSIWLEKIITKRKRIDAGIHN